MVFGKSAVCNMIPSFFGLLAFILGISGLCVNAQTTAGQITSDITVITSAAKILDNDLINGSVTPFPPSPDPTYALVRGSPLSML